MPAEILPTAKTRNASSFPPAIYDLVRALARAAVHEDLRAIAAASCEKG